MGLSSIQMHNSPMQTFIFSPLLYCEGQQRFKNQLRKVEAMLKPKSEITMRGALMQLGAVLHPQPAEGGYLTLQDAGNSTWQLNWVKDNAVCHCYIPDSKTREAPAGRSLTLLGQLLAAWQFVPNYVPTVEEWLLYCQRWLTALAAAYRIPAEVTASDILMQTYAVDITSEQKARVVLQRWVAAAREV